ncbi:MAG: hypothetical protein J6R59_10230 [Paludibacteraceae bacterium]|nr:hypothetical protein [Paludibacteraceae bacterium]
MNEDNIVHVDIDKIIDRDPFVSGGIITPPPPPQCILWIGDKYYRTSLLVDQHFNWFQKLMWKWCFGVKVENYNEE